jgi:hypothetical protein
VSVNRVGLDISAFTADLEALAREAPLIMARAVNRAGVAGRTAMVKAISQDTGLLAKYVTREIKLDKATRTTPTVTFTVSGKRLPLIAFGARGPEPSRGRGRGVSYRLPTGRGRVENAFIATMPQGHRGVFKRVGGGRLPIIELRGPSIPHVFEKFIPQFIAAAQEGITKSLLHEISFAKSKRQEAA